MSTLASTAPLTDAQRRRSLIAILSSAFGVALSLSMAMPLVSLALESRGHSGLTIGLVAAVYAATILVIGPLVPRVVGKLGTIPTLFAGSALAAVGLMLFPLLPMLALAVLLRLAMGIGNALDWVVSETWINAIPSEASRGRVVALYAMVFGTGLTVGPMLLAVTGTDGHIPFWVAGGIIAVAFLPVLAARDAAPDLARRPPRGALRLTARAAPVALVGAFLCGISESSTFSLLSIYGIQVGLAESAALLLVSAFAAGSVLLQVPVGWLADRVDRSLLMVAAIVFGLAALALIPVAIDAGVLAWAVLFLWGGASAAFYTLGLILLGQRFGLRTIASATTAFIMAYTVGMMLGPFLTGAAMDLWPPHGFVGALLALYGTMLAVALLLIRRIGLAGRR